MALALVVAPPATAQSSDDEAAARAAFEEGERLLQQGRHVEGRDRLRRSLALYPHASTAFNLALAYRGTGQALLGIALVDEILAHEYGALQTEERQAAEALRDELVALTGSVEVENVEDVEVELTIDARDGRALAPHATERLRLDAGDHALAARAPGRIPFEAAIRLEPGGVERVALSLELVPERADDTPLHVGLVVAAIALVAAATITGVYLATTLGEPLRDPIFGLVALPAD